MYRVFPYYISKIAVDTPMLMITPMISSLMIYWAIGLSNTVEQFFGCYLVQCCCAMAAASIGYFLSSIFENEASATAIAPLFIMPMMLFGGLFTNNEEAPGWLSWIQYISPIKYCSEALMWNELQHDPHNIRDSLLPFLGYDLGFWNCVFIFIGLIIVFRTLAFFTFNLLVRKF